VILVDANLLIYAHVSSFPQHVRARDWLDGQLSGRARVGLPWPSLLGFLRIVTNPRVFQRPESITDAWGQVGAWLEAEVAWIPQPTERHREVLGTLLRSARHTGQPRSGRTPRDPGDRAWTSALLHRRRLWPLSRLAVAESARRVSSRGAPTQLEMVLKVDGEPAPK